MGQCTSHLVPPLLHILKPKTRKLRAIDYSRYEGNDKFAGLPLEIIFNIFSRLPADTLVGLRSVCKLWNYLIRDPHSIGFHLPQLIQNPPSRLIRIPPNSYGIDTKKSFPLEEWIENGPWIKREIQVENLLGKMGVLLYGSCNGLICLAKQQKWNHIFICNPVTGESIRLPKSRLVYKNIRPQVLSIGFGFHEATKKYKVLRLLCYRKNTLKTQLLGEVITLGERSWRKLDIPVTIPRYGCASSMLFFNGFLYWMGAQLALIFDIGSEKFGTINLPFSVKGYSSDYIYRSGWGVIEGSLVIVRLNYPGVPEMINTWRIVGSMAMGFRLEECSFDLPTFIGTVYAIRIGFGRTDSSCNVVSKRSSYLQDRVSWEFYYEVRYEPAVFMPSFVSLSDIIN